VPQYLYSPPEAPFLGPVRVPGSDVASTHAFVLTDMDSPTDHAPTADAATAATAATAADEIRRGERFAFGRNWRRFLDTVDPERIAAAEHALATMLDLPDLRGRTFLDAGCGSGLSSLAARRLGARVRAFDFDAEAVACARELKRRTVGDDPEWTIEPGDVLDDAGIAALGTFDIVYSWGVLHHTGAMWRAVDAVCARVAPGGILYIALYNDQGGR